jgi:hypothetical protein
MDGFNANWSSCLLASQLPHRRIQMLSSRVQEGDLGKPATHRACTCTAPVITWLHGPVPGCLSCCADLAAAFMLLRKPEYNFLANAKKVRGSTLSYTSSQAAQFQTQPDHTSILPAILHFPEMLVKCHSNSGTPHQLLTVCF